MSGKATLKNFADILGTAKLPERIVPVCLRGDLVAEIQEQRRLLEEAEADREKTDSLDAGAEVAEIEEKIAALRTEMKEHTYPFRIRALPRREYRAMLAAHPPRKVTDAEGNETIHEDDDLGFNTETMPEPLLRVAIVDPELTDATWASLQERLIDRQFDDLSTAAWLINRQAVDFPFSSAASR